MDFKAIRMIESQKKMQVTILHRAGGVWHSTEVNRLVNDLMTEASQLPQHPEYLMLFGHYTKEETLRVIGGGVAYTAKPITGVYNNPELASLWVPFV